MGEIPPPPHGYCKSHHSGNFCFSQLIRNLDALDVTVVNLRRLCSEGGPQVFQTDLSKQIWALCQSSVSGGSSLTAQQSPRSLRPRIHSLSPSPKPSNPQPPSITTFFSWSSLCASLPVLVLTQAPCRAGREIPTVVEVYIGWNLYSTVVIADLFSVCQKEAHIGHMKSFRQDCC